MAKAQFYQQCSDSAIYILCGNFDTGATAMKLESQGNGEQKKRLKI
jgi:hypothetical protein